MFIFDEKCCTLCPRRCGSDRSLDRGLCGSGNKIRIARAAPHFWEEPCISGEKGAGAVFFSGCSLLCNYCQNYDISHGFEGMDVTEERFYEILSELCDKGVHNLDLVTADHFVPYIKKPLERIKSEKGIPLVYNCSGYQSRETLSLLESLVDIYLVDMKYFYSESADRYSCAKDYPSVAMGALEVMLRQTGEPEFDSHGIMKKGVIVRHLVLPGASRESAALVRELYDRFGNESFIISLMSQYTPNQREGAPERKTTTFEYERVAKLTLSLGFKGYFQDKESAKQSYTPDFDLTGVLCEREK